MNASLIQALRASFEPLGFRTVTITQAGAAESITVLKRQTWNTNRAIAVIQLESLTSDFGSFLKKNRWKVAMNTGFFPFFYSLGLQMILVCKNPVSAPVNLAHYTNKVDNQLAIIQSIFLIDESQKTFSKGVTWGQFVTGKYQTEIQRILSQFYKEK